MRNRTHTDFVQRLNWVIKWLDAPVPFNDFCQAHSLKRTTFKNWVYALAPTITKLIDAPITDNHRKHLLGEASYLSSKDVPLWHRGIPEEFNTTKFVFKVADEFISVKNPSERPDPYKVLPKLFKLSGQACQNAIHVRRLYNAFHTGELKLEGRMFVLSTDDLKPSRIGFSMPSPLKVAKFVIQTPNGKQQAKESAKNPNVIQFSDSNEGISKVAQRLRDFRTAPYVPNTTTIGLGDLIQMKEELEAKRNPHLDEFVQSLQDGDGDSSIETGIGIVIDDEAIEDDHIETWEDDLNEEIAELQHRMERLRTRCEKAEANEENTTKENRTLKGALEEAARENALLLDKLGDANTALKETKQSISHLMKKVDMLSDLKGDEKLEAENNRLKVQLQNVRESFQHMLHHTISVHAMLLDG